MRLYIDGYYGPDGAMDRLHGILDGTTVELRAVSLTARPYALVALEDTAALLSKHPDTRLPEIYGVVTLDDWTALVVEPSDAPSLRRLCSTPLPEDVATTLVGQIAEFLERIHALRDPVCGPLHLTINRLCSEGLRVDPDGIRWCQPETLLGVTTPERRLPPHNPTGGIEDDVHDLGIVMMEMLLGSADADETLGRLATLNDAASYHRRLRNDLRQGGVGPKLARILEKMCSYHADERPQLATIIDHVSAFRITKEALATFRATRVLAPTPLTSEHPLVELELGDRPAPAGATLGPDDWSAEPLRPPRTPPRPTLPEPRLPRLDTGGVTIFERQAPRRVSKPPAASPDPTPAPDTPAPPEPPAAPYVPPAQLDTPDMHGSPNSRRIAWVVGGGCFALAVLAIASLLAVALGIGIGSVL